MNRNFLKRVPVAFIALATSVSVFAAGDTDSRLQQLEQQMKQVRTETAVGTFGAKTATARPEVGGACAFFTIDALLWKGAVGGTDFAYTDSSAGGGFPIKGTMKYNDFGWDWGVRVGLGYNFDHDNWEGNVEYTYFTTDSSQKSSAGLGSSIIPLKGDAAIGGSTIDYCTSAKSTVSLTLNNVDATLARNYFISKDLSFRPHFGLKSSWVSLDQSVTYEGGEIVLSSIFKNKDENKFWGIGPNAGVDSKWYLCNGFSVYGSVSGSLLWGYYKVNHYEQYTIDPEFAEINIQAPMHRFAPNAQLALGLSYDKYLNNNKQHIGITLGWETLYYFRVNQSLTIDDFASKKYSRVSDDVSFQGVTLHLRLDF